MVVDALDKLGIEHKGRKFRCPNPDHPDNHPSADWFGDGRRWKCRSCGAGGDAFEAVKLARGCTFPEARAFLGGGFTGARPWGGKVPVAGGRDKSRAARPVPAPETRPEGAASWPAMDRGTDRDWQALGELRGIRPDLLRIVATAGILRFGEFKGHRFWAVRDDAGPCCEARRMDGEPWPWGDREKAHAFKGSKKKDWPVGLVLAGRFRTLLFCEGPPDMLAAWDMVLRAGRNDVLPVGMLGAGSRIGPRALEAVAGRPCAIWAQDDKPGREAVDEWAHALAGSGCRVRRVVWPATVWHDGDVNEWLRYRAEDLTPEEIGKRLPEKGDPR